MNSKTIMTDRRPTREVKIGDVTIGGGTPIVVQSMTNVPTSDIDRCVDQINRMAQAGCELVRVAVPTKKDTAVLSEILSQVSVPLIADVHFHYRRAMEAINAGIHKIRLNPGNISDRKEVEEVIAACKANGTAIRVGVNQGSIQPRGGKPNAGKPTEQRKQGLVTLMVDKLSEYVAIFEDNNFDNLVLSAKCHDGSTTIMVNRAVSERFNYPLHLGVTHAGTVRTGSVRSAAALGALLAEGIGDTIRVSLAGDPLGEIEVAWEILNTLKLRRRRGPELIACPTCGRTQIDMLSMVEKVSVALREVHEPIVVAVMGCVVNGPGEAAEADVALCGGKDKAVIYCRQEKVATVPADKAVEALLQQVKLFVAEKKTRQA
jgi:(E)-4-hydroxy-3-methylbut-2-enyl-diphosphate synthase